MPSFLKSALFTLRELLGIVIIALLFIGASRLSAEEPLPSQDEAIARAVENHPDIIAAKAKLALAESELNGKRMEVSRQVLQGYSGLKNLEAQTSAIKAKLDAVKHEFGSLANVSKLSGAVSATELERSRAELQAQEAALVQTMLQREQTEKELQLLIGSKAAIVQNAGSQSKAAMRRVPQGPLVEQIRLALGKRTNFDVADQPLGEQLTYLSDKFNIAIQIHPDVPKDVIEGPVRVVVKDVPLPSAFQAIEDFNNGRIQFVVRDYGIVLMNRDQAEKNGFMPLSEFAKEKSQTAAADDPWERARISAPRQSTPGGPPKGPNAAGENPFEAAPAKK